MPLDGVLAEWLPNGIEFAPGVSFDEWRDEWSKIETTDKAIQWIIGDALVYGEANFPEWTAVLDPKYAEKHRSNMWVSTKIPRDERRDGFSYSFHRELASLDKAERDRWFDRAIAEGWDTVARLNQERAAEKQRAENNRPDDEPPLPLMGGANPPPPASEDDYGIAPPPQSTAWTPTDESGAVLSVPAGNRAEMLRALIVDVREFGDGWRRDPKKAEDLYKRIDEARGKKGGAPLEDFYSALTLKPEGWRMTMIEKDDGSWEVRLRAEGQKQAIALSAYLENAITEACLTAELSA